MVRLKIQVSGRVQGVGFRAFAQQHARQLALSGYVKNLVNGDVYIEAEGVKDNLNLYLQIIEKGPSWGHVDHIKHSDIPAVGESRFSIRY